VRLALVTGAGGFIGGRTVDAFVDAGWRVLAHARSRPPGRLEGLAGDGAVTLLRGDLSRWRDLRDGIASATSDLGSGIDCVAHCAGRASDVGRASRFRRDHLDATLNVVRAVGEFGVGRLVHVSSTDVYGLGDFDGEAEEELPLAFGTRHIYPRYKILCEQAVRDSLDAPRYTVIRPAAVWGRGDTTLTSRVLAFLRGSGTIVHFGRWRGRNRWPLAHVGNVAGAIVAAAEADSARGLAINVLDRERTSVDEFYRLVARTFLPGRRMRTVCFPVWAGRALGWASTSISNLLDLNEPVFDPSLYALETVRSNLSFGNARFVELMRSAGRHIVALEEGLEELLD